MSVRVVGVLGVLIWIGAVAASGPHAAAPSSRDSLTEGFAEAGPQGDSRRAAAPSTQASSTVSTVVTRYCAGCHNDRAKTGGLTLTTLDLANIPADAEVWEKVIRKVRTGLMPPVGVPHPDGAMRAAFVSSLATTL